MDVTYHTADSIRPETVDRLVALIARAFIRSLAYPAVDSVLDLRMYPDVATADPGDNR
jgi:hypothetical protein